MTAEVAEISMDQDSVRLRFHRVVAAFDCGRIINPGGTPSQIADSIVMDTSAALQGEIAIKDGRVQAGILKGIPVIQMAEAPDGKPRELGEPPIRLIALAT